MVFVKIALLIFLAVFFLVVIPLMSRFRSWGLPFWTLMLVVSVIADPITTIDFHMGERHNVRGWEFCWPEIMAPGVILAALLNRSSLFWLCRCLVALLGLHLTVLMVSSIAGINIEFSLFYMSRQVRMYVVLLAVILALQKPMHFWSVLAGLAIAVLLNEWEVVQQKYRFGRHQCIGLFDHQNAMAMWEVLVLPVLLGAFLVGSHRLRTLLFLGVVLLAGLHSVLASLSRASLLMLMAVMGLTWIWSWTAGFAKQRLLISGLFGALVLLGVLLVLPTLLARFADSPANDASHRTREVMNDTARVMHADHPWLGLGPNNYAEAVNWPQYGKYIDISQREKGHKVDAQYKRGIVESHFWQMRSETGWLGYVTWLMVLGYSLLLAGVKAIRNKAVLPRLLAAGIGCGFLGTYVQSLFEHTLVNNTNLATWMVLCAVLVRLPWSSAKEDQAAWMLQGTPDAADRDAQQVDELEREVPSTLDQRCTRQFFTAETPWEGPKDAKRTRYW